jgi:phosphoglycerate dehydrogenase-like enzyme
MPPFVINTAPLSSACAEWLEERVEVQHCDYRDEATLRGLFGRADGLVIATYLNVNDGLLDCAPRLKVVGRAGVGLEHVDLEACRRHDVRVVYTPQANCQAVVEYVFALMLDALRPRPLIEGPIDAERFFEWRRTEVGRQLDQLTLGVIGFGQIGRRVGAVARAIGMRLIVNDLLPEDQLRGEVDFPFEVVDKATLYANSDVLSIHVDGRAENRNLIGDVELAQLRPDCLVINAARGMVLDAGALARWAAATVETGGQAVLDVLEPEPPAADCPLFGLPNVRLHPHLAARTDTALEDMGWVVRDVWAVLQGEQPRFSAW